MSAEIEKYLGTVMESTAKTIASRLGLPQLDVSRELSSMVKDGTLEREMRKGEYAYWLTRAGAKAAVQAAPATPTPTPVAKPEMAADAPARTADDQIAALVHELLSVLGLEKPLKKAIAQARAMVAERDELREKHNAAVQSWGQYKDLLHKEEKKHAQTTAERDAALAEIESQKAINAKLRENTTALERSIDDLTGVADVQLPKIYVTVGRNAGPKRHADLPRAQKRAAALVRNEKELEVLVLAPVGRMVRGSEWRSQ